jgi:hypothetical protein
MKRLPEIILSCIMALVVLPSGTSFKFVDFKPRKTCFLTGTDDTSDIKRFIRVDTFRLRIIPPSSGVQFYKNGIVFLSISKYEEKMLADHISFGAIEPYYSNIEDSVTGRHLIFPAFSSFPYPCEAMTFSRDYTTFYFTKYSNKDKKENIYKANWTTNNKGQAGWVEDLVPLEFCSGKFSFSHPTLSSDENMLVFASNMEGSFGGMDLFVSRFADGKWSSPENLGGSINTPGNEFFPFLDSENNLYFSSDRLPGSGGYDVFTSKFNGSGWDKPGNLSNIINTDKDDIAFIIDKKDGKTAFYTRRQKTGRGEMQLFKVKLKEEFANDSLLTISSVLNGSNDTKYRFTADHIPDKVKRSDTTQIVSKIPEKEAQSKTETTIKPAVALSAPDKAVNISPKVANDEVIYRVQLLPDQHQKSAKKMVIDGKDYSIYEYLYRGEYRCTIGEFKTLAAAIELQRICRQSGYSQSFVVAFKNNTRSLDPNLFK